MILRTPRSTLTDTLFPYTTLFRSVKLIALFHNKRIKRNCVSVPAQSAAKLIRNLPGAALDVFASAARDSHAAEGIWNDRRFGHGARSEEHTSELQSLMRISYAVFGLKKKH